MWADWINIQNFYSERQYHAKTNVFSKYVSAKELISNIERTFEDQ